ncbi:hypothetical protein CEXT_223181 [Caerostris extrusa]|uniref:Uncharacterized protein n=1 Tax=Caerostris extrusa TaxID=172846 RepID=A0AAV4MDW3_CAEEX|nr:hypothetical protein CEXT_223181 [Caerostris extrusa]
MLPLFPEPAPPISTNERLFWWAHLKWEIRWLHCFIPPPPPPPLPPPHPPIHAKIFIHNFLASHFDTSL